MGHLYTLELYFDLRYGIFHGQTSCETGDDSAGMGLCTDTGHLGGSAGSDGSFWNFKFSGNCVTFGALVYPWLKRMPAQWGMLCSAVLLAVCWTVPQGGLGTGRHILMKIPESFYDTSFLYWLGFPSEDFYSSDYFPVFPWIFLFFFGVFLGEFLRYKGVFEWMSRKRPGTLAFLGRHSLCIYLLHQPVLYGVCIILKWLY